MYRRVHKRYSVHPFLYNFIIVFYLRFIFLISHNNPKDILISQENYGYLFYPQDHQIKNKISKTPSSTTFSYHQLFSIQPEEEYPRIHCGQDVNNYLTNKDSPCKDKP